MESMRNRARDMFPMVLLTLLSIVQALALDFLWDHTRHRTDLFELSVTVLPGWLQIAATLNLIVLIWLTYAGMLMRFRWTPTTMDSIFPFLVGLIQFLMIEIMGDEYFALWIMFVGVTYAVLIYIDHYAMKRARQDEANHEFFDRYAPATIKDFVPPIIMFWTLFLSGLLIRITDYSGWFNVAILVVVFIALGYETHKMAEYWKNSMGINEIENDA
jgi:hypothetical protein